MVLLFNIISENKNNKSIIKLNPFLVLGISNKASFKEIKSKFRTKLMENRYNSEKKAEICLAYDILTNKEFYKICDNENEMYMINVEKNKEIFCYYYTIIGDFFNLIEEMESIDVLNFKDSGKKNLLYIAARNGHDKICEYLINKGMEINDVQWSGSTALHGAAYYGHTNVIKLLLNYGAKTDIKNKFNHLPIDEAANKEIKDLLKESEKDPIFKLYQTLYTKNISKKLIPIIHKGNNIGKKILCKLINLPNKYKIEEIEKNWVPAWHGTNFTCLESIAEMGLKPAGGKLKNGEEIQVCISHIARDKTINKIPDWANAIFVSPSVFYAGYPAYAKEIACNNELYKVLIEVRVRPGSYIEGGSTCSKYVFKKGEPKNIEYRIEPKNEKDVQVFSLTFIKNEFFEKTKIFEEGNILLKI